MTLPTTLDLPLRVDYQNQEDVDRYQRDLVFELQNMYEKIAENVNGTIRNYADTTQDKWVPTLKGSIPGTFTYTQQVGWSIRQGIFTHVFFDVSWSATTAAGALYLELPYKVAITAGYPFTSNVGWSNLNLGGYSVLYIRAESDSYNGAFWASESGLATAVKAVDASGKVFGNLFYIGIEDE